MLYWSVLWSGKWPQITIIYRCLSLLSNEHYPTDINQLKNNKTNETNHPPARFWHLRICSCLHIHLPVLHGADGHVWRVIFGAPFPPTKSALFLSVFKKCGHLKFMSSRADFALKDQHKTLDGAKENCAFWRESSILQKCLLYPCRFV